MSQAQLVGMETRPFGDRGFYPTPPALCTAICQTVSDFERRIGGARSHPLRIVEPSAGTGNFVRAARAQWPDSHILAVDVADHRDQWESGIVADWEKVADTFAGRGELYDMALGNPDFDKAVPHIYACLRVLKPDGLLAFILRLSFWETPARAALFSHLPVRAFAPIVQRPSFTGKGGDKTGVGLFIWQRGFRGQGAILPAISWR
jgi:hypothetical protein